MQHGRVLWQTLYMVIRIRHKDSSKSTLKTRVMLDDDQGDLIMSVIQFSAQAQALAQAPKSKHKERSKKCRLKRCRTQQKKVFYTENYWANKAWRNVKRFKRRVHSDHCWIHQNSISETVCGKRKCALLGLDDQNRQVLYQYENNGSCIVFCHRVTMLSNLV